MQSHSASDPQLSISTDDADMLRSLLVDYLRHEDALRGRVRPAYRPVRLGEMGGILDALLVALGPGAAGAALATVLSTWLSHPRRADVKLTITTQDGRRTEIHVGNARDPVVLLREIERLFRPQAPE